MDTSTQRGRDMRRAQIDRERIKRLIAKFNRTGDMGIALYLYDKYGIGDFDISPDGDFNRA